MCSAAASFSACCRHDAIELEKNFTSPSFALRIHHERAARLAQESDEKTRDAAAVQAERDRLLHKRKGLSGSEFAGVGVQFAVTIVAFAFAGIWLDGRLGTSPWFVLVMVLGGGALGFWSMVRRTR